MRIVSFDGHDLNDGSSYKAWLRGGRFRLPKVAITAAQRDRRWPIAGAVNRPGHTIQILISIIDSDPETAARDLATWFDPDSETAAALIVSDDDDSNERYVMALCQGLQPYEDKRHIQIATLMIDGDVRYRTTTLSTVNWNVTASGQTTAINNTGECDAYPTITVKPTSYKSSGSTYTYRMFVPVRWRETASYATYPLDVVNAGLDTATLVTASKMQADGDDLRLEVDGTEHDRWLSAMNGANTKVWTYLDFSAEWSSTIVAAIGSGDTVTSITVDDDTSGAPASGILVINSEVFTYTAKSDITKTFSGITRAAKGSTAAAHSASDAIWWCQHDVTIKYGNTSATTPSTDDDYKPMFDLASSTNTSWVYTSFGEDAGKRTGQWTHMAGWGVPVFYGGNQAASADPWTDPGYTTVNAEGQIRFYNPCGITNVAFTNGEKRSTHKSYWQGWVKSSITGVGFTYEYTIPDPSANNVWEAWTYSAAVTSGSLYIWLEVQTNYTWVTNEGEFADCTITLDSGNTPTVTLGAEVATYSLNATITNNTTGVAFSVQASIDINEELEISTEDRTVLLLTDDSSQLQALDLGDVRRDWLALQPGNNELQFDDAGTQAATIKVEYRKRYR